MTAYQRAAIHEAIETLAKAQESLRQQELELRSLLEEDSKVDQTRLQVVTA